MSNESEDSIYDLLEDMIFDQKVRTRKVGEKIKSKNRQEDTSKREVGEHKCIVGKISMGTPHNNGVVKAKIIKDLNKHDELKSYLRKNKNRFIKTHTIINKFRKYDTEYLVNSMCTYDLLEQKENSRKEKLVKISEKLLSELTWKNQSPNS
jgi:hypothetical protein